MAFQPFNFIGWVRGCILVGEPDDIPADAFRRAVNVRIDRTLRAIEPRPGWTRKTVDAVLGSITFLSRLYSRVGPWCFFQYGSTLRVADSNYVPTGPSAVVGAEVLSDVNFPDGHGHIWKMLANRTSLLKQDGAHAWMPVGISPPPAAPVGATLATDLTIPIDTLDNATVWVGTDLISGPSLDSDYTPAGLLGSITFSVAPSTYGTIHRWLPGALNLDAIPGGDPLVALDDYFSFWIRTDFPERVVFLQVDVDIDVFTVFPGDNAFRNNYYSVRIPSLGRLNQGHGTWTKLQIRKAEFARFGEDATRSWANAQTFKFGIQTTGQGIVQAHVSNCVLRGGIGLEGEITYTVCYRNAVTGARGNPPKAADYTVLHTLPLTVDRQRVNLDISNIRYGVTLRPGEEIDTIMIWRQGGTFTSYVKVAEIAFTATSPYLDHTSDETLILTNDQLELDNDLPPNDTTGSQRVIFGPDGTGHYFMLVDGYKLYFCKPYETLENRIENWPRLNYALVGDGSSKAITGCCEGSQTYVFTDTWTYTVVGIGAETYLPVRIDGSRGIVGQHAWCAGEGALFFVSQDGIYLQQGQQQRKITSAIDPFFQGLTVSGQRGWNLNPAMMALVHLAYLHEPTGPTLTMLYADSDSSALNQILTIKPNIQSGVLTECFFDYSALTAAQCLHLDVYTRQLLAGGLDGHIYRLHDAGVYNDNGTAIPYQVRTQSSVCGGPTRSKYVESAVVQGHTHGQAIALTAYYECGDIIQALGSVNTTTETALTFLSTPSPRTFRHDVALELSGSATNKFTITRLGVMGELQPEYVTRFDSGDIAFEFVTQLKVLLCDLNTHDTLNLTLTIDQEIVFTGLFLPTVNRHLTRYGLPAGLRGRVFSLTLTGSIPFLVYKVTGLVKQLGVERNYLEHLFMQGT